jgi:hypothetical protein
MMVYLPSTDKVHNVQMLRKDFGDFFSDLASKNVELLTSLASALKILTPPCIMGDPVSSLHFYFFSVFAIFTCFVCVCVFFFFVCRNALCGLLVLGVQCIIL